MALVTAGTTLLLIVTGGIVSGLEAGLAVEGWLNPEGYPLVLFPLRGGRIGVVAQGQAAAQQHRVVAALQQDGHPPTLHVSSAALDAGQPHRVDSASRISNGSSTR